MSRKPLTPEEHKLKGTRPTRAKPVEQSNVLAGKPQRPAHLSRVARKEWAKLCHLLAERGTLSPADSAVLELYVATKCQWLQAQEEIEARGMFVDVIVLDKLGEAITTRKLNPAVRVAADCSKSLRAFLIQFGMTPAAREKIKPTRQPEESTKPSIFDLIKGKQ